MTELHTLTATEAARRIASRELSPVELVDALLRRIDALEPRLQVWATLDADGARTRARELTDEAARGAWRGPLHGVPVGVKDIFDVAGLPTRAGSRVYDVTPAEDATTVARLRAAGAIILGKTHTTEFAMADPAPTRNPWNPAHTPGGSSSGSAAGVAAAMMPAALGTQTAGSVLRPASFCGVVGFKPTYDRLSREGIVPLAWSLDHPGTLTRSVEDAALLFDVMAEGGAVSRAAMRSPAPPRIGVAGDIYPERLEQSARQCLRDAADRLADAGAVVQAVSLPPEFDAALDAHHVIMAVEASAVHLDRLRLRASEYGPRLRVLVETGALVPAPSYLRAQQMRRAIRRATLPLFAGVDCLLVPAAAGPAPVGLEVTGDPSFNTPWSLLGVPAISLPAGLDPHGLPIGVQLVAVPWQETRLFAAAAWCETVLGRGDLPAG